MENLGHYVREMQKKNPDSLPLRKRPYDHAAGRTPEVLAQENRAKETDHSVAPWLEEPEKRLDCSVVTGQGSSHKFSVVESNSITLQCLYQEEGKSQIEGEGSNFGKRLKSVQEISEVLSGREKTDSQEFVALKSYHDIAQWVRNNNIKEVFVQANYMSGDRYAIGIATAIIEKECGILIVSNRNENSLNNAKELVSFYNTLLNMHGKGKDKQNRIAIYNMNASSVRSVGSEYKFLKDYRHYAHNRYLNWFQISRPVKATLVVASFFNTLRGNGFHKSDNSTHLVEKLISGISGCDKRLLTNEINKYLKSTFADKHDRYAFIWAKAADATHAHFNHSLPNEGLAAIIDVAKKARRHPVLVGDKPKDWNSVGGVTELWDFWNDGNFPEILKQKGRVGQLLFFRYLAISDKWDVVNIGMRAGNLEGAALFGMPTIYIEEKSIDPAKRLEHLLPYMKNFCRLIIDKPVGEERKVKLAQEFEMVYQQVKSDYDDRIKDFSQAMRNVNREFIEDIKLKEIFYRFKPEYMQKIQQHIESLKREQEKPFTSEELEVMKQMLSFSGADIKDGKRIDHWRVGLRNKSIVELFCEGK